MSNFLSGVCQLSFILGSTVILSSIIGSYAPLQIELSESRTILWEGCIFKKYRITDRDGLDCSECAENGTKLAKFNTVMAQDYKNCTRHCRKPTICTMYKYNFGGVQRSECYQCENGKNEEIRYRTLQSYKLCSDACKKCAREADISTAIYCSFKCAGKPTFCYPKEMWYGHYKCYRARQMFGCRYAMVKPPKIQQCLDCSQLTKATHADAQECAAECDGIPTYRTVDSSGQDNYFQCSLGDYGEVFEQNIPPDVVRFLKVETPLSLTKAIDFLKYVPTPPKKSN